MVSFYCVYLEKWNYFSIWFEIGVGHKRNLGKIWRQTKLQPFLYQAQEQLPHVATGLLLPFLAWVSIPASSSSSDCWICSFSISEAWARYVCSFRLLEGCWLFSSVTHVIKVEIVCPHDFHFRSSGLSLLSPFPVFPLLYKIVQHILPLYKV